MRWTVASRMSSPLLFENIGPVMTVREPFSMRWKSLGLDQDRSGNRKGGLSRPAEPLLLGVKENPARRDRSIGVTGQGCREEAAAAGGRPFGVDDGPVGPVSGRLAVGPPQDRVGEAELEELVIEPDGPGVLLLVPPAQTGA